MEGERATNGDEYRLVLTPTSTAATSASQAVRRHFGRLADERKLELASVVRALVERSATQGPEKAITITIAQSAYSIRGEVAGEISPSTNGNVAALLDEICSRWAVYAGTTDVWFEIPLVREPAV